jgi:hypothetical protein
MLIATSSNADAACGPLTVTSVPGCTATSTLSYVMPVLSLPPDPDPIGAKIGLLIGTDRDSTMG